MIITNRVLNVESPIRNSHTALWVRSKTSAMRDAGGSAFSTSFSIVYYYNCAKIYQFLRNYNTRPTLIL